MNAKGIPVRVGYFIRGQSRFVERAIINFEKGQTVAVLMMVGGPVMRDDVSLLEWAVGHAGNNAADPGPRWSHVAALFGLDSTSAAALCRRFAVDPDERVGGCKNCYTDSEGE